MPLGIRLTVVDIKIVCLRGTSYYADCCLNSLTPGHPCATTPRCPHVLAYAKTHGWRTHRIDPVITTVDALGRGHDQYPLKIIYCALDPLGLTWMAINVFTGERHEVILHADFPHRRTPEGDQIESSGLNNTNSVWTGVPRRENWRCQCSRCSGGGFMQKSRQADPFDTKPLIDPKTVKSATSIDAPPKISTREWREREKARLSQGNPSRYFGGARDEEREERFMPKAKTKKDHVLTTGDVLSDEIKKKGGGR